MNRSVSPCYLGSRLLLRVLLLTWPLQQASHVSALSLLDVWDGRLLLAKRVIGLEVVRVVASDWRLLLLLPLVRELIGVAAAQIVLGLELLIELRILVAHLLELSLE